MLGEWYLPPGKCQAISTITEGIISISHPAPLSSQTRIPQTSSPLVDKSQATQAALLQIRRSEDVRCAIRRHQVAWLVAEAQRRSLPKVLYVNLDDSLGKKDKRTSRLEPVDWFHDHNESTL